MPLTSLGCGLRKLNLSNWTSPAERLDLKSSRVTLSSQTMYHWHKQNMEHCIQLPHASMDKYELSAYFGHFFYFREYILHYFLFLKIRIKRHPLNIFELYSLSIPQPPLFTYIFCLQEYEFQLLSSRNSPRWEWVIIQEWSWST